MKTNEDVGKLLDSIHSKPAMFWGGGEVPFTSLVAFLHGYKLGFGNSSDSPTSPENLVPSEFHNFVAQRLDVKLNGKGWPTLIREHSASEEEAFDLFFKLRKAYEESRPDSSRKNC